jgi:D-glycero-alpha-D-manno-heptose-7-phosphate kinase
MLFVTKVPLRISFFGGGSDIPAYHDHYEGQTLSVTIDKYIYLTMKRCESPHLRIVYSRMELVNSVEDIKHDRVRESLKYFGIHDSFELCSFSDIPLVGTGLGSSSSFTVGMVEGLNYLKYKDYLGYRALAEKAFFIETHKCRATIGKQDQYAAAKGGFNLIKYTPMKDPEVTEVSLPNHWITVAQLKYNLLLFNSNITRSTDYVLDSQVRHLQTNANDAIENTHKLVEQCKYGYELLQKGKLDDFGALLGDTWEFKKRLNHLATNPEIDKMYDLAIKAGALGGKILGAGGGGFLLVYCPVAKQNHLRHIMNTHNYPELEFKFSEGTESHVI